MTTIQNVTNQMLVDLIKKLVVIKKRTPEQQKALTDAQTLLMTRREREHREHQRIVEAERADAS